MKNAWRIFLLLTVLNSSSLVRSEPQYQQQQNQLLPQGNSNNNNINNNNQYYGPQTQQPLQQQQQQQQQQFQQQPQQPPYRFRAPIPPTTTAAPTFFQRISSWFNFFGDDSGDRRPSPPPPRQPLPANPPPLQQQPQQFQPQQQFQQQQTSQSQPQQPLQPLQNQQPVQPIQFPQPQTNDPNRNGSRIGVVNSNYTPSNFINQPPNGGFQPILNQNHNYQSSGSNFHLVANAPPPSSNTQGSGYHYQSPPQAPLQHQQTFVPSTLQQKIVGSQQDPRILRPSQAYHQNMQYRDPEPTTIGPGIGPFPGAQNAGPFDDFDYHPCNNVPWIPVDSPLEHIPVTQQPTNIITPPSQTPIKLEIRPKGHVHSVSPYPGAIPNHEPVIITAAPPPQHLIQLQLQQQQQQLQNLQLQQLQLQQQQLQQQLQQLKVASSSSQVYTTVAYNNEDSKPAASEHRNVTITGTNQLSAEDEDYSSEEDIDQISGVTVTFPVEVTSVVPKTRYYSSRTTTTERPTTLPSSLPPPTDPEELGNGLHIIYSANLYTSSPASTHLQRQLPESELEHADTHPPVNLFNNLLSEEDSDESVSKITVPFTVSTQVPPTKPISTLLSTLKVTTNRSTIYQRYPTTEPYSTEVTTTIPHTVTTAPPTTSLHHSSMTAAIGGYINTAATKKPKQIQIIIPYSTYKKPEPFKPKDEIDHSPEESMIVTATSQSSSTPPPLKSRFVTRESMKFFHSTSNIKDILRKETTRPFSRPPTAVPEKPTKLKKVEPVKISKDSKPFTPPRIPKMTPMPPVFNLSGLSADHRLERTTTTPPRTFRPTIIMAHPSRFAPHYINITRMRPIPTSQMFSHRTTISQLLRTTKIITNPPKSHEDDESRRLSPIVYRKTTVPTTTTTSTERPVTTPIPIYERNEWDIDPLLLQRRIDTWTEQQYASDDYLFKSSTIPLHRVTKAIPWEFLTTTMLPSLRDRAKGRDSWRNVKIAISPHTKEKVYVVTPQPWTAIINQETVSSPRFSIRPTPFYQKGISTISSSSRRRSGSSTGSTVDVSPESVNDLVEHKSKLHRASLSPIKLKHRKYVRQKDFTRTPHQARFGSSTSSGSSEST